MSWDEKLFRTGLGIAQSLFARKQESSLEGAHQVTLTEVSPRLKLLASALAEEAIEISEAESIGGMVGSTMYLPARIAITNQRDLNLQAYIYRVAYSITLAKMGIVLSPEFYENTEAQLLMSLLAVPLVRQVLLENYPGIESTEVELRRAEASRRDQLVQKTDRMGAIQGFISALVSDKPADGWAGEALKSIPSDKAALAETTKMLLPGLLKLPPNRDNFLKQMPVLWSLLLPLPPSLRNAAAKDEKPPTADEGSLPTGTEKKGKPKESVEEVKLSKDKEDENPLVHAFEKVKTADDYIGGKKMLDGADELQEQLEAIEELDLRKIIRTRERTNSIYRAELMLESGVGDLEQESNEHVPQFFYDEWDCRTNSYKKAWCKLFLEDRVNTIDPAHAQYYVAEALQKNARQVRDLRRQFEEFIYVRRWRTRQPDGPEIDLDAVVDRYAALRSGHTPSQLNYLSQRPQERDFATLVLLDSSLSTDSWLQNRRVMDVLKESVLVLGEVIEEFRDRISIGAFYSNTRTDCRYIAVKRFDENWKSCQTKLVGLKPTGYTRIGPALRHGTFLLKQMKAKKKLLLLISDGKPTDYDRYEGRYGIEDIRQAIREASSENVTVQALAIEAQAKFYLPQMFGTGNYQILPNPNMLASSLAQIYGWLSV